MKRRDLLRLAAPVMVGMGSGMASSLAFADDLTSGPSGPEPADWDGWKAAFLTKDGRVVDHLQEDASHSEGQGYGMFLATWFGDARSFRRMHDWTTHFLTVRQDPLLAWRWKPHQSPQISDYNNATDGDLFYAWALLRAGERFAEPAYTAKAIKIARFLAASCVRADPRGGGRLLLLPGAERFALGNRVTVNPSYYMPLAMRQLGLAAKVPDFLKCADHGEVLLTEIAAVGLVPDWIEIGPTGWYIPPDRAAQSGYDALRSALFLIWSGRHDHVVVRRMAMLYQSEGEFDEPIPTVADLLGGSVIATSDLPGYEAVASLVACAIGAKPYRTIPVFSAAQPYFPATMHLFSKIAARTASVAC